MTDTTNTEPESRRATQKDTAQPDVCVAELTDRGVLRITGTDAAAFLQNIITNDMALLDSQPAIYTALLQPQGKILFDFFVMKTDDGYLIDMSNKIASGVLAGRLSMYKLRSDVTIVDISNTARVYCAWGPASDTLVPTEGVVGYRDPRLHDLGQRLIALEGGAPISDGPLIEPESRYHHNRIHLGVPDQCRDFSDGDIYPHEALLDQLHGVSFTKGCYIGQEIVSRMHHRGTVRKRIVPIEFGAQHASPGATVQAGDATIGTVLSNDGAHRALALIRLDRAHDATEASTPITVDGAAIDIKIPLWATFSLANSSGKARV